MGYNRKEYYNRKISEISIRRRLSRIYSESQQTKQEESKKKEQYTNYYHLWTGEWQKKIAWIIAIRNGFNWKENGVRLYDILDRVSCWCCANKNKKELENMRIYLPQYYLKYIDLLKQIKNNNKRGVVVDKAKEQFMKLF